MSLRSALFQIAFLSTLCVHACAATATGGAHDWWKQIIQSRIQQFGHRNWIVIADSAYPTQSAEGIETIVSDARQMDVLDFTLKTIASSRHVIPTIYTDQELRFLTDRDAPGISGYRDQLFALIGERKSATLLHEQLMSRLDAVSKMFRVLVVKTNVALPYTTVFLQLDCSYWPPEAEARLRSAMAKHANK